MTSKYLDHLWSKAIHKLFNGKCVLCNKQGMQAHHYISRRKALLRCDYRNGFLLCIEHHKDCHTKSGEARLIIFMNSLEPGRFEYLCQKEKINIKDYLVANGLSRKEFMQLQAKELKDIINE